MLSHRVPSEPAKSFVVFSGRKPGVFTSWIDCYAQANGYKDSVVRLYDTTVEGNDAWTTYQSTFASSLISKSQIEKVVDKGTGYTSEILSNISDHTGNDVASANDNSSAAVLISHNMQKWLCDACRDMRFEEPNYILHDVKDIDGKRHYRFRGSLYTKTIGKPRVCLGKYARTEDAAREDVSVMLLRHLLSCHGMKIYDYNQHNVDLLECQLQRSAEYNFELRMENAVLAEELKILRSKKRCT